MLFSMSRTVTAFPLYAAMTYNPNRNTKPIFSGLATVRLDPQ